MENNIYQIHFTISNGTVFKDYSVYLKMSLEEAADIKNKLIELLTENVNVMLNYITPNDKRELIILKNIVALRTDLPDLDEEEENAENNSN